MAFAGKKRTVDIDLDRIAPCGCVDFVEGFALPNQDIADALHPDFGIVYEPVNGTETVDRFGDYVLTLFPLRNVTFDSKQPVLRLFLRGNASKLAHLRGTRRQIGYDDSACHCEEAPVSLRD